jgi:mono/diheme cytochrome c family protein
MRTPPGAVAWLAAFSLTVSALAANSVAAETAMLPAVATSAQAEQGAALYAAKCTGCHSAALGEGGHGPPLKGDYFWTTWGGQSARKLYGMIISTMPASDPGSLSQADTLALVAFILRSNGYPPGSTALAEPADLQDVNIHPPAG